MKFLNPMFVRVSIVVMWILFHLPSLTYSQNGHAELVKLDTTGANYSLNFILRSVNLEGVRSVQIFKRIQGEERIVKDVSILPVGEYFQIDDETNRIVKDVFYTRISINKAEYRNVQFSYRLIQKDKTLSYPINKVW